MDGMETETTPATSPPMPDDAYNLVPYLSKELATEIATKAVMRHDKDWESASSYRQKRDLILRLFVGDLPAKPAGAEEYAQVHLPIVSQAVWRIHARIYDQRFPAKGGILSAVPTGPEDTDRSSRVSKHFNWQLTSQMPEYVHEHDANMISWLLYGSSFTYTYRDQVKKRPCVHALQTDDVVIKYTRKSRDPNLSDVPRITRRLWLTIQQLEELEDSGQYVNVDEVVKASAGGSQEETKSQVRTTVDRLEGVDEDPMDDDGARMIIEQHCWLTLPSHKRKKPVIITVDHKTNILLGLVLREDEDPIDRARFERENDARQASIAAITEQHQMGTAAYLDSRMSDTTAPPIPGAADRTPPMLPGMPGMTPPPLPGAPGQMPVMPDVPPPPSPPRLIPINFFTHYVCNYNPEGIYGLGIGMMLAGHNMAADTIMSQLVEAGTLANIPTYIHSKQAKLKRGEIHIRPGHSTEVDLPPEQLKSGFQRVEFPPPNPSMFQVVQKLEDSGEGLSGAGDILTGEVGGSRETATTTKIRSAMAMSSVTIMGRRYDKSQKAEARLIARINARTLNETEYKAVVNVMGDSIEISRADYHDDFDITFTADPRLASQPQRIDEAKEAMAAIAQLGPLANAMLLHAGAVGLFKAMDRDDLLAALGPPPPPTPLMPPGGPGGPGGPPQKKEQGNNERETPGPQNSQAPPLPGPPPLVVSPQGIGANA